MQFLRVCPCLYNKHNMIKPLNGIHAIQQILDKNRYFNLKIASVAKFQITIKINVGC